MSARLWRFTLCLALVIVVGLGIYFAAPWMVSNPISVRVISVVRYKDNTSVLRYEMKNHSPFPVRVLSVYGVEDWGRLYSSTDSILYGGGNFSSMNPVVLEPGATTVRELPGSAGAPAFKGALFYRWQPKSADLVSSAMQMVARMRETVTGSSVVVIEPGLRFDRAGPFDVPEASAP